MRREHLIGRDKEVERDSEGFAIHLPTDMHFGSLRPKLMEKSAITAPTVELCRTLFPELGSDRPDVSHFHRAVSLWRARVLRIQAAGYSPLHGSDVARVRNCVPPGYFLGGLTQWACRQIGHCPFCHARRAGEIVKRFVACREEFNSRWSFHVATWTGRRSVPVASLYPESGDDLTPWRLMVDDMTTRIARFDRAALGAAAAVWGQLFHFAPADDGEVDIVWQVVAGGRERCRDALPVADEDFAGEPGFSSHRTTEATAASVAAAMPYQAGQLYGDPTVMAKLLTLRDAYFRSAGRSTTLEAEKRRRFRPKAIVIPPPRRRVVQAQEVQNPEEEPMAHPAHKAIHEWLTKQGIKSTAAQRHALLIRYLDVQMLVPETTIATFIQRLEAAGLDKATTPDKWGVEALVNNNCPQTDRTAKKHGVNAWPFDEIVELFDTVHLLRGQQIAQGAAPYPVYYFLDYLVKQRNANSPRVEPADGEVPEEPEAPPPVAYAPIEQAAMADVETAMADPAPASPLPPAEQQVVEGGEEFEFAIGTPVSYRMAATGREVRGTVVGFRALGDNHYFDVLDEFGELYKDLTAVAMSRLPEAPPTQTPGPGATVLDFGQTSISPSSDVRPLGLAFDSQPVGPTVLDVTILKAHGYTILLEAAKGSAGVYIAPSLRRDGAEEVLVRARPRTRSIYGVYTFQTENGLFVTAEVVHASTYSGGWRRHVGQTRLGAEPAAVA